jgi:hypothetical protein
MKTDFISVNDYKKNKNILWETYYENDFDSFILKRVEKDCAKNIKEIK